jgi:hypothetical protein
LVCRLNQLSNGFKPDFLSADSLRPTFLVEKDFGFFPDFLTEVDGKGFLPSFLQAR